MAYDEFTAKLVADNERLRQEIKQNEVDLEEYRLDVERLRAALVEIRDAGPMTLDDQRWLIALAALEGR
jgi:hypothetical protein